MRRFILLSLLLLLSACSSHPLSTAVFYGDLQDVQSELAAGADPNRPVDDGPSVFWTAVFTGEPEPVIRALLEYGAEPNARHPMNPPIWAGATPLHVVRSEKVLHTLIEFGADPTLRQEDGSTPLHSARTAAVAGALIASGADVDAQNKQGSTPLHTAKNPGVTQALLANGADPEHTDNNGRTPAQLVQLHMNGNRTMLASTTNAKFQKMIQKEMAAQEKTLSMLYAATDDRAGDAGSTGAGKGVSTRVIRDNTGRYLSPYTSDGVVAEWVNKTVNNRMGSATGSAVGGMVGAAAADKALENVPGGALIGGFFGSRAGEAVGSKVADNVSGGDAYRRRTSDLSFRRLSDMATWLVDKHGDKANFREVVSAANRIYPGLAEAVSNAR